MNTQPPNKKPIPSNAQTITVNLTDENDPATALLESLMQQAMGAGMKIPKLAPGDSSDLMASLLPIAHKLGEIKKKIEGFNLPKSCISIAYNNVVHEIKKAAVRDGTVADLISLIMSNYPDLSFILDDLADPKKEMKFNLDVEQEGKQEG